MAEINPTRINQPPVDLGQEISPDGNPVTQMAAPSSAHRASSSNATSMQDAPTVNEDEPTTTTPEETNTEVAQPVVSEDTKGGEETQIKPKEEDEVADFTEFLKVKDTGEPTDELQKQKSAEVQPTVKPPIAERKAQDAATRDLTGLPDDLVPHFQKDMSRAAFDKVKPIILEHKTLKEKSATQEAELERLRKGAIPDSYYDNPNGFVLDPEYQKAEMAVSQAQAVLEHWQKQYRAVNDGAADFHLAAFDANGNLVTTNKVPAGPTAVTDILAVVNNAQQQMFKVGGKAEALRENFKQKHSNALGWLGNYENKAFQVFNTEQGKQFEPQLKSIISEFPPEFRNHPLTKVLAKSIATNVHLATLLVQNNKNSGTVQPQVQAAVAPAANGVKGKPNAVQQQRRAGPTAADVGASAKAGNGKNDKEDVTTDMFQAVKDGVE